MPGDVTSRHKPKVFSPDIRIDEREIGRHLEPYIIAELSGNHKGSLAQALSMIDAASDTGADAIKLQTYRPDTITLQHDGPEFLIEGGLWAGRTLYDLYQEAHTPWEWHEALFERAKARNITLFSSPFDDSAVDLLESLGCPAYKIASFEINDIALIRRVTQTGKPVIISTGLATFAEIEEAINTVADMGGTQLALLHCISAYPTPIEDCNLRTISDLSQRFDLPIGLSDHTSDNTASITAVALGASIIEKHFVLDKSDGSVDAEFSLDPTKFADMTHEVKRAHSALGTVSYDIKPSEAGGREFRRSLYISHDIKKGQPFTTDNVRSIRPGLGLHTRYLPQVLEQYASKDISFGSPLSEEHLSTPLKKTKNA